MARQRMKERCATDPAYKQRFVDASRKGAEVLKEMRKNGQLKVTEAQLAALHAGRVAAWKDDQFRKRHSSISSKTMAATNRRRGAGEFPEWDANNKNAASATMNKLWENPLFRNKVGTTMSRTIKAVWKKPGHRIAQCVRVSTMHKRLWSDPEYRKKMASRPLPPGRIAQRIPFIDRQGRSLVMKSRWETKFAAWLDSIGLNWEYEPLAIDLQDGRRYFPDFWIEQWGCFIEIKGRDWGLEKVTLAVGLGWNVEVLRSVSTLALQRLGEVHSGAPWK